MPEVVAVANELKVVIFNKTDFAWAEKYAAQVTAGCRLYLQPEWEKAAVVTPLIVDYIKENPGGNSACKCINTLTFHKNRLLTFNNQNNLFVPAFRFNGRVTGPGY